MIKVDIDGKTLEAENGEMIIAVADRAGIPIPRFCYHKKLSIAANCRMCLVEVEKSHKPLPACATPVAEGMKVMTCSDMARDAQKAVMEFLLINHPLDCPICDQGGECELQDVSLSYGDDISRYTQGKRAVKDKDIGPLIATDMTRCIHCTRCVRFGQEIAGVPELGCTGRGESTEIGTYVAHSLQSEVAGNMIDLCPVGALTNKPFRFAARAWELNQHDTLSPHDCLGTHIHVHERRGEVMRVVPKACESINETWIADRDRFGHLGLKSPDRLLEPRIKRNGRWETVDWLTALKIAVTGLGQVLERQGPEQVAGVIHPNATVEEMVLFQKWLRAMKVANIDHRIQMTERKAVSARKPRFDCRLENMATLEAVVLIGASIRQQQPLAGLRIRQAGLNGAMIAAINPLDYAFNFTVDHKRIVAPVDFITELATLAKVLKVSDAKLDDCIAQHATTSNPAIDAMASALQTKKDSCLVVGTHVLNHPQASLLRALIYAIADATQSAVNEFPEGGNPTGAHLAGALPDRTLGGERVARAGLACPEMFDNELAAYVLFNVEPEMDLAEANKALSALDNARFVIQISSFVTNAMELYADVMLPVAPFTETSGTYVNIEGRWQSFQAVVDAAGSARPGWKILRVLANLCQCPDFEYTASSDIRDACKDTLNAVSPDDASSACFDYTWPTLDAKGSGQAYWRISQLAAYRSDPVVRRSEPLQDISGTDKAAVYLNTREAKKLKVQSNDWLQVEQDNSQLRLQVAIDDRVPDSCVYTPTGFIQTNLGDNYGIVTIRAN